MPDTIVTLAQKFQAALRVRDKAALNRIIKAYVLLVKRIEAQIEVASITACGVPDSGDSEAQLRKLLVQARAELNSFMGYLQTELGQTIHSEVNHAGSDLRSISIEFHRLPTEAIESLLGYLDPDGPLVAQLNGMMPTVISGIEDAIWQGVATGKGPKETAKLIHNQFGIGLTNAMRVMRTTQLYAYREATRANYLANQDVVRGWYWMSALKPTTCASCINQHGRFFTNDKVLNDHHNGFCTMLPAIKGRANPLQMGGEWLAEQPDEAQAKILGKGRFEMYKQDPGILNKLTAIRRDKVYGDMRFVTPLSDLK